MAASPTSAQAGAQKGSHLVKESAAFVEPSKSLTHKTESELKPSASLTPFNPGILARRQMTAIQPDGLLLAELSWHSKRTGEALMSVETLVRSLGKGTTSLGLLLATALLLPTVAQASLILPSATLETVDGNTQFAGFGGGDRRSQWLYGDSLFPGGPITITGLQFRQSGQDFFGSGSTTFSSFRIDVSATTATGPLGDFDTNHGADRTTVFNGPVTISYTNLPGDTVANPFATEIVFSTPFVFDPTVGLNLLFDFQTTVASVAGSQLLADRQSSPDTASALDTGFRGPNDSLVLQLSIAQVPEPGTLGLLGAGLISIGVMRRRRG